MYECAIYGVGGNAGKFYAALFFFILKVTFSTVFYVFWSKERSLKAKFTLKKVRLYLWPVFIHNLVVAVALVIIIGAIAVRMGNADRSYHAETAYQNDILISGLVLMFVSVILFLSKTIAAYLIWRYYMFIVNQLIVQEDIEGEELTEMQV
ncbi:unnamed protein product [Soboliphyme baturini]|uniref:DUF898 family protein n=1 Tax=Soboliphyme baturini TaxID=241478 RepID=A0A183J015_9BILA|nr:unnamed protein product [Soboliphyme baturini]